MAIYDDELGNYYNRGVGDQSDPPPPATPSPGSAPADPWATAPTDGNWQTWFLNNVQGMTPNSASLIGLEPKLAPYGIQVQRNAAGIAGKIVLPDGTVVDVGRGFSGSDPSAMGWQWLTGTNSLVPADRAPIAINPDYLAPWTKEFTFPNFQQPTAADLYRDPSYQFRLDQGRGMLENSAAARGVLNSGGTLWDILNYGQQAASQEYGSVWDRMFNTWGQNYANAWKKFQDEKDSFYANQTNPWLKLRDATQLGAGSSV